MLSRVKELDLFVWQTLKKILNPNYTHSVFQTQTCTVITKTYFKNDFYSIL